jgi:hypothetical protein
LLAHPHIRARLLALAIARTPFRTTAERLLTEALDELLSGRALWAPATDPSLGSLFEFLGGIVNGLAWRATHSVAARAPDAAPPSDGESDQQRELRERCERLLEELRRRLRKRSDDLALKLLALLEGGVEDHAGQATATGRSLDDVALAHRRIVHHVRGIIRGDPESEGDRETTP